jgi:pre-mRNA-processing factor SLU7
VNKDPRVRTAVRNLRQREDTAKYLRNLDPNSAAYDGKARIMKENPNPDLPEDLQLFKGDNFVKYSGDALSVMKQEAYMIKANQALANDKDN